MPWASAARNAMIAICRDHAANVKRWRDGQMVLRWVAAGMGEAAKQFRRINGYLHLPALRAALDATIVIDQGGCRCLITPGRHRSSTVDRTSSVIATTKSWSSPICLRGGDYPGGRKPCAGQPATTGGWAMEIQHSTKDGCQVALTGSIDLSSVSQIQRALLKDLSEDPFAVICDPSGVQQLDPVCATVFATVANHPSSRWPATSFLLCCAQPPVAEILGLLTVPHFLQLYASLQDALDAAVVRPPSLRDERAGPDPTAPATARAFVRDVLGYWQLALPIPRWWIGPCWWPANWSPTP